MLLLLGGRILRRLCDERMGSWSRSQTGDHDVVIVQKKGKKKVRPSVLQNPFSNNQQGEGNGEDRVDGDCCSRGRVGWQ